LPAGRYFYFEASRRNCAIDARTKIAETAAKSPRLDRVARRMIVYST
jgi:hypothetical protein